jgi:hypothetical protein
VGGLVSEELGDEQLQWWKSLRQMPGLVEGGVDKQNQIAELVYVPSQSVILDLALVPRG